ncbi:DSBA oxidoreductase [Flavimobilis marinus]|nr:DSBA oxidoreductase [Flavimobilis marinus]
MSSRSVAPTMNPRIKVDVWSDIACPWCYIGKRRLEKAITLTEADIDVEYHSFELAPDTPHDFEGPIAQFFSERKGVSPAQAEQMFAQVTQIAAGEDLAFDYPAVRHTKTLKAHELLHHAKVKGLQYEMKERLLKAYFTEGVPVGRLDELVRLAEEVGLDGAEVRTALEAGDHADDVAADMAQARAYGINGVPFFVIDGRYGVSGAQEPSVLASVFAQALAERGSLVTPEATSGAGHDHADHAEHDHSHDVDDDLCADGTCAVPSR